RRTMLSGISSVVFMDRCSDTLGGGVKGLILEESGFAGMFAGTTDLDDRCPSAGRRSPLRGSGEIRDAWAHRQECLCYLAEVTPVVELVGIFGPAVADVGAVIHVGDED